MTSRAIIWLFLAVTFVMVALMFIKSKPTITSFDKAQAERDIRSGNVRLLKFALSGPDNKTNVISSKYGFKECNLGCVVGYSVKEQEYLELVNSYLDKRNGIGWQSRYIKELHSAKTIEINLKP